MNIIFFWTLLIVVALAVSLIVFWPVRKRPLFFILGIALFSSFTLGLYYYWGNAQALETYYAEKQKSLQVKKMLKNFKNTDEIIAAMKKAIDKNPKKSKGWYLLGQLYRSENNLPEAISAFQKAYQLNPSNFNYTYAYLQVLYKQSNQQYTPVIQSLIAQLKKQSPDNPELLDFLGYDAYMHNDYASAIQYWEKLLPYLADNPKAHKEVLLAIGKAEKQLLNQS
jgi:cytochrome c-type biogenesis protein CcmH/NrfG